MAHLDLLDRTHRLVGLEELLMRRLLRSAVLALVLTAGTGVLAVAPASAGSAAPLAAPTAAGSCVYTKSQAAWLVYRYGVSYNNLVACQLNVNEYYGWYMLGRNRWGW